MNPSMLAAASFLVLSLSATLAEAADPPAPPAPASAAASAPRKHQGRPSTRARDKRCHQEAAEKHLKGKPRQDFMGECRRRPQ